MHDKRVLVADDNETTLVVTCRYLEKRNYIPVQARNGIEVLDILQSDDPPRVLILDWMMPEMDGPEVCRYIQNKNIFRNSYIIMLTSKSSPEDIVQALGDGADDFITKPVHPDILYARLGVAFRITSLHNEVSDYAENLEKIASERARQLLHADRMTTLGMLTAGVAHEINNPVSFISINIENLQKAIKIIKSESDSFSAKSNMILDEIDHIFNDMRSGVERINKIVDGLKTYSRSGEPSFTEVDVNDAISESLKLCENRLKYSVTVNLKLSTQTLKVNVDKQQLEQVLVNLIINAADAMERSETQELTIKTSGSEKLIEIYISDTGPGIEQAVLEKLFNPFFTTKETNKGTGLGLSISKTIIDDFGGNLSVHNNKKTGATFVIKLKNGNL